MLHPRHRIDSFLSNGSTAHAIGDYSSAVERFTFTPLTGRTAHIYRLLVTVEDAGAFDAAKYGNNITLANGIQVVIRNVADDTLVHDLSAGPIKTSADWGARSFDADVKTWGVGNEILVVRWTFARAGSPLALDDSMYLSVELHDTFVALVDHRFLIQGEYV